jgi:hypothetical protein
MFLCFFVLQKLVSRSKSEEMKLLRDGMLLFLRFSLTFKKDQISDANRALVNSRLVTIKTVLQQADDAMEDIDEDVE